MDGGVEGRGRGCWKVRGGKRGGLQGEEREERGGRRRGSRDQGWEMRRLENREQRGGGIQ